LVKIVLFFLIIIATVALFANVNVAEATNSHLFVSASNPTFDNHFSGSMVVEVVIRSQGSSTLDDALGEPDVTINGKTLRMVQTTDGNWYAYFANLNKAKVADNIAFNGGSGVAGVGLDFGVFCSKNTNVSVLGVSFSETEGVAIPRSGGIAGSTNGLSSFTECTGSPTDSTNLNNVVRNSRSINTNSNVSPGQIGLDKDAWPIIQLFSFNDVVIQYNGAGKTEKVELEYDDIPNITLTFDRQYHPRNSEVFITINDMQLNQDPTDEDSWTFNIGTSQATFYRAFTDTGSNSANTGSGLINLVPSLSQLGFEDNGKVSLELSSVGELKTNNEQPFSFVTDGITSYSQIITFVESEPNSGIFENFDNSDQSNIGILSNAPRGQSATIKYDSKSYSILSGSSTASLSITKQGNTFNPGQKIPVMIIDPDQNINQGARDDLDVFRSTAIIPSLKIGNPITLEKVTSVKFYEFATTDLSLGTVVTSSVPDKNSDRLVIDTTTTSVTDFDKLSLDLGVPSDDLNTLFLDSSSTNIDGTNWLNYDLRSFEKQLDVDDFSDTTMILFFGSFSDPLPVTIIDKGDISNAQGLVQIDDDDITAIGSKSGTVFVVINFDSSNDAASAGTISSETDTQPIVLDFFSFGEKDGINENNAIYRFELEETSSSSGTFTGTMEYTQANQLNKFDPSLIQTLKPISDQVRFLANDRLIDEKGIILSYSDIAQVGATTDVSSKSDIKTHSGKVSLDSSSYRFGQPVQVILVDNDLNVDHGTIETFFVINDPNSPNVDTVGSSDGGILLEIEIKGSRYKRCTIDGVQYGGLGLTGFSLSETGPGTGIFKGSFKMPSQICDKPGTKLISPAGGSIEVEYHDFRDSFGEENIFRISNVGDTSLTIVPPTVNSETFLLPESKKSTAVIITGKIENYRQGIPVYVTLTEPDNTSKVLILQPTNQGNYKGIITLYSYSMLGTYSIDVVYQKDSVGELSFKVIKHMIPDWIKNNAQWWGSNIISDNEFVEGVQYLINEDIIKIPVTEINSDSSKEIPKWIKNNAKWYGDGLISSDNFVNGIQYLIEKGIIRIDS